MKFRSKIIVGLATGGYLGFLPVSPGTFRSLPGIFCSIFLPPPIPFCNLLLVAGVTVFAVWVAGQAEQLLGAKIPVAL
ncbi:MAG: hypothetical protein R2861_15375 [Desulfobacterales bacterium]